MSEAEHNCSEHCGIFTIGGPLPIQGTYRDICYQPVRDNIWTASEGIYRTIFLEGTFFDPKGQNPFSFGGLDGCFPQPFQ